MSRTPARTAIRLAGLLLAGLPAPALALADRPPVAAADLLASDGTPLVLTRTVVRPLPDGQQITVSRSYEIRVTRSSDGAATIDGRQIAASVEAPPLLAVLARLERERIDTGMFPLRLDPARRIVSARAAPAGSDPAVRAAEAQSRALLGQAALTAADRAEAEAMIARLAAGASSEWPADLFDPAAPDRTEERRVVLPDGQFGTVATQVLHRRGAAGGLPLTVERSVVTRLDGTERTIRESWVLSRP